MWCPGGYKEENYALLLEYSGRVALNVEFIAEELKKELGEMVTSAEKRAAASKFLEERIKLPGYMELFDDYLIPIFVDKAVMYLNKKFGKEWGVSSKEGLSKAMKVVALSENTKN